MSDELEQKIKDLEVQVQEGAPAWVVTFGDLMSLLLCFFVLLLSFSETDKAIYKDVAGSMAEAFGVQRKLKVMNVPKGITMIARDFNQPIIETREKEDIGKEVIKEIESRFQDMKDLLQVDISKDGMTIRLMGESTFDSGKAEIRARMIPLLEKIGSVLKKTNDNIIISGHTDNVPVKGSRLRSNLELSMARAASVAQFLIHHSSIDPRRISTMGFGEYRPIESNDTSRGREKNRRVEIILGTLPFAKQPKKSPLGIF